MKNELENTVAKANAIANEINGENSLRNSVVKTTPEMLETPEEKAKRMRMADLGIARYLQKITLDDLLKTENEICYSTDDYASLQFLLSQYKKSPQDPSIREFLFGIYESGDIKNSGGFAEIAVDLYQKILAEYLDYPDSPNFLCKSEALVVALDACRYFIYRCVDTSPSGIRYLVQGIFKGLTHSIGAQIARYYGSEDYYRLDAFTVPKFQYTEVLGNEVEADLPIWNLYDQYSEDELAELDEAAGRAQAALKAAAEATERKITII